METFLGYLIDSNGRWDKSIVLTSDKDTLKFIQDNISNTFEIKITDMGDRLTFHVKQQELLFPLVCNQKQGNKWYPELKMFVDKEDFKIADADVIAKKLIDKVKNI